jgi:hypothetical protein
MISCNKPAAKRGSHLMRKSVTQLLEEIDDRMRQLRSALVGDPATWPVLRRGFEYLRRFEGRPDGLDYRERAAAAKASGYDNRGTGGFYKGDGCLARTTNGDGRSILTGVGKSWVELLAKNHPGWV